MSGPVFYLGTHQPHWLWQVGFPLFVSRRQLARRKTLHPASCRWALDSGGFTELSLHGRWVTTAADYAAAVARYATQVGGLDFADASPGTLAALSGSQPPSPAPAHASMPDHQSEAASGALSPAEHQFQETPMPSTTPERPDGGGAAVLAELHAALTRYVILPTPDAAVAVTLWIAATHAQDAWQHAPRLVIRAPEKRCGKSRLLDIVEGTCHNPLITVNASPAAVYRAIGADVPPTLLVDEADTIFGGKNAEANEDLRGLLNAGHQRNRPALRYDAGTRTVEKIPTFAMAALAGIGVMPDTIEDRAVVIKMRRRAPGEKVAPLRHKRDRPALTSIAAALTRWLHDHLPELERAEPPMPLEDRAADTWEPLIAVADLAAGHWPGVARAAAVTLTADHDQAAATGSEKVRLLADIRAAFGTAEALPSTTLAARLRADPEAPWCEPAPGITPKRLAAMLGDYDIRSTPIRFGEPIGQVRGYYAADFADAWSRYCPPPRGYPSQPSQPSPPSSEGVHVGTCDTSIRHTVTATTPLTCDGTLVTDVTDTPRLYGINGGRA